MIERIGLPLLVLALWLAAGFPVAAGALPEPTGPVVLTVAGKIGKTNRPAFDDFEHGFFKYHDKRFETAAAFDRAMLEGLGLHEVDDRAPGWPKALRFEGPWLKDVLAAVEPRGECVSVFALGGYGVEIALSELDKHDWLLALKRDGANLGLGQRGPTWIVYTRKDGRAAAGRRAGAAPCHPGA